MGGAWSPVAALRRASGRVALGRGRSSFLESKLAKGGSFQGVHSSDLPMTSCDLRRPCGQRDRRSFGRLYLLSRLTGVVALFFLTFVLPAVSTIWRERNAATVTTTLNVGSEGGLVDEANGKNKSFLLL